jgi:hypothetical protein
MLTLSLSFLFLVILAGFGTVDRALKRAPEGYEDESGFHFGPTP